MFFLEKNNKNYGRFIEKIESKASFIFLLIYKN